MGKFTTLLKHKRCPRLYDIHPNDLDESCGLQAGAAYITPATFSAGQQAYQAGASLAEVQQQFSLSRGSVQRLSPGAEVRRRRVSLTDAKLAALLDMQRAGLTIREIAADQGLAKTTVQDALARTNVVMRPAAPGAYRDLRPTLLNPFKGGQMALKRRCGRILPRRLERYLGLERAKTNIPPETLDVAHQ